METTRATAGTVTERKLFPAIAKYGEFEPKIIEKRQTRTDEIEQKIMALYAKVMSQRDIEDTLRETYGSDISQGMISKITDRIHHAKLNSYRIYKLPHITIKYIKIQLIHS